MLLGPRPAAPLLPLLLPVPLVVMSDGGGVLNVSITRLIAFQRWPEPLPFPFPFLVAAAAAAAREKTASKLLLPPLLLLLLLPLLLLDPALAPGGPLDLEGERKSGSQDKANS